MNQWMSQMRSTAGSITRKLRPTGPDQAVGGSSYPALPSLARRRALLAHPALPSFARRRALLAGAVTIAGIVLLFFCYLRLSRTFLLDSDGASNALQAWAMLHGNPLLRGWTLSDVSFYATELPEYMLVELVHGLNGEVVHIAAGLTYTLLVVLVALVAKGQTTGKRAVLRMLIAAGIMISPQLGAGVHVLLMQPDHTGTNVPVLLAWLLVDRGGRRWWVPPATAVLLAVAYVADAAALVVGIVPLLVVAGWRVFQRVYRRRPVGTEFWPELLRARYELAMMGAALVALAAGRVVPAIIRHLGGYSLLPVPNTIAQSSSMLSHIWSTVDGVLLLFGADFFGLRLSFSTGLVALHLVGVALAVWAVCAGVRRFGGDDLVSSMLTVGALLALVAFMIYPRLTAPREMAAVLPFSAALAGRLLAGRLAAARLEPVIAVVLCLYVVALGINVTGTPESTDYRPLASWLADHGLRYGLSNYDFASSVTLASGNRVQVRPVATTGGAHQLYPRMWEADKSWYNPSLHNANFVIQAPAPPSPSARTPSSSSRAIPGLKSVLYTFGRPARSYRVDGMTVLVWDYNLLTRTAWGQRWPVFDPSDPSI
jgi:hypothetical protein